MFHSTRLKLTTWYLLIIMFVSMSFSFVIYNAISTEIERFERMQRVRILHKMEEQGFAPMPPTRNPELLEETRQRALLFLMGINVGIFIISGGLGYFLAGRTLRPIKDMMDEQNRFISDASHELRTPLTSLKSAFEVFLRSHNPQIEEAKLLATESIDEVNKLTALSDSLLQLSQYQKSNGHTQFEKYSLDHIINSSIKKITSLAKNKNILIKYAKCEINVEMNKESCSELFVILLENAIKYSNENTSIYIEVKKEEHNVIIKVKDEGIGIDEKDQYKIFQRFYRVDISRSKKNTHGYGLGLSIAKRIVDIHNGTIYVESKLGEGSSFIISLPLYHFS
ncbi:MAG: HAMP domain-containing sensor histidine kinase [Candidatus Roizmanbacteria bacterium]